MTQAMLARKAVEFPQVGAPVCDPAVTLQRGGQAVHKGLGNGVLCGDLSIILNNGWVAAVYVCIGNFQDQAKQKPG